MAPLEPWEKVFVNFETFSTTVHGQKSCMECHGGEQSKDKASAHSGLVSRPSEDPETICGQCHPDIVAHTDENLHANLQGYWTAIEARSTSQDHQALVEMFGNHCESCHTSCGDCHISQPASVGGGFIDGHIFNETPSMTRNCTACHGSRVGNEYMGKHEDIKADVHFRQGRMSCIDCHDNHEMHGYPSDCQTCHPGPETASIPSIEHRYDGVQSPRCESCHTPVTLGNDGILMHEQHGGDLSCQVCHAVSYTSCDGCHVAISETSGNPFFSTEGSYLGFFIGKNVYKSYDRPYEYVTVRHIPVDNKSFEFYGANLLADFNNRPTWSYTTPHNIQRNTPQTESCDACHGNSNLFLTIDMVDSDEVDANLDVIVTQVPPSIFELLSSP